MYYFIYILYYLLIIVRYVTPNMYRIYKNLYSFKYFKVVKKKLWKCKVFDLFLTMSFKNILFGKCNVEKNKFNSLNY